MKALNRVAMSFVVSLAVGSFAETHPETRYETEGSTQRQLASVPEEEPDRFAEYEKLYVDEGKMPLPKSFKAGIWTGKCAHRVFKDGYDDGSNLPYKNGDAVKMKDALLYVIKDGNKVRVMPFSVDSPVAEWVKSSVTTGSPLTENVAKCFDYKGVYEELQKIKEGSGTLLSTQYRERIPATFYSSYRKAMHFTFPYANAQPKALPALGFDKEQSIDGGFNEARVRELTSEGKQELVMGLRIPKTESNAFPKGVGSFCKLDTFLDEKAILESK